MEHAVISKLIPFVMGHLSQQRRIVLSYDFIQHPICGLTQNFPKLQRQVRSQIAFLKNI